MKESPILFSGSMVRAILDGRKTQTRRIIKRDPLQADEYVLHASGKSQLGNDWRFKRKMISGNSTDASGWFRSPFGVPGDQLWVRDPWTISQKTKDAYTVTYKVDWDSGPPLTCNRVIRVYDMTEKEIEQAERFWKNNAAWYPSIHMPSWASRIQLEVVKVRVERLQDITEQDVIREGACMVGLSRLSGYPLYSFNADADHKLHHSKENEGTYDVPTMAFNALWESINAARDNGAYAWDKNPWVWVIEFKQIKKGE